jgi:hypothetical protein
MDLQYPQARIRLRHFYADPVSPVMKIKVFHENDAVQYVELELQEDSQSDPTEYFPEFFHFQGLV